MSGADPSSALSQLVARQLGREPAISFSIVSNCVYGWPSVIRNQPLDRHGDPHPNLYYLTCPWLRRALARLEDSGFIVRLQEQVAADNELLHDLERCQEEHASEYRLAIGSADNKLPRRDMLIAGAGDPRMVKCLHSHMAWFLVHPDYRAGQIIADEVGELWCPDDRCAAWMAEIESNQTESSGFGMP